MSIRNFTDLDCWNACRELADWTFNVSIDLPAEENFGLRQNLNAAARAATRNIATGHNRPYKESRGYCRSSRGALNALHDDLITATAAGYIDQGKLDEGVEIITKAGKLVSGYIRYLKAHLDGKPKEKAEEPAAQAEV